MNNIDISSGIQLLLFAGIGQAIWGQINSTPKTEKRGFIFIALTGVIGLVTLILITVDKIDISTQYLDTIEELKIVMLGSIAAGVTAAISIFAISKEIKQKRVITTITNIIAVAMLLMIYGSLQ